MAALQAFFDRFALPFSASFASVKDEVQEEPPQEEPSREVTKRKLSVSKEEVSQDNPTKLTEDPEIEVLTTPRKVRRSTRKRKKPKKFE